VSQHKSTHWQALAGLLDAAAFRQPPPKFNAMERQLLELRLSNLLACKPNAMEVYDRTSTYYAHMSAAVDFRNNRLPSHLLADEHLFQLFVQEMIYIAEVEPLLLTQVLQNRAFVVLTRNENVILANQKQRAALGEFRAFIERESDEQRRQGVEWFNKKMPPILALFKRHNTPFVEIDLDQGMPTASVLLGAFLNGLNLELPGVPHIQ